VADRIVTWKAIADFSAVRKEAAQTQASLAALQAQVDKSNASNKSLGNSTEELAAKESGANTSRNKSYTDLNKLREKSNQDALVEEGTRKRSVALGISEIANLQKRVAAKREDAKQDKDTITASQALARVSRELAAAKQNEAIASNSVVNAVAKQKNAQNDLTNALAKSEAAMNSHKEAAQQYGDESKQAAKSLGEWEKASNKVEEAQTRVENSTRRVTTATLAHEQSLGRVSTLTGRVESAENSLAATLNKASNDGGKFGNALDSIASGFDGFAKGAGSATSLLGMFQAAAMPAGILALVGALSSLVSGLFAVGSAIAPALGGLAAIGPMAIAGGAALGTLKLATSGIGAALQAYGKAQAQSGVAAQQTANQQITSAQAITRAQQAVDNARQQVGVTERNTAASIVTAEHTIQEAQYSSAQAQQALTLARKAALQNILDLKNATVDAALAERGASLSLQDAQLNLRAALNNPQATALQRAQAQLAVDSAKQQLVEAKQNAAKQKADSEAATKAGVEGSTQVKDAKHAEQQAIYQLTLANQNYTKAVQDGARSNAQAQQALQNAIQSLADAQRQATIQADKGTTAQNAFAAAMAKLTPQARAFVNQLISMKGMYTQLKQAASAGFFPGASAGLQSLTALFPALLNMISITANALGGLAADAGKMLGSMTWQQSMNKFAASNKVLIDNLGHSLLSLVDLFRAISVAAIPLAEKLSAGFREWAAGLDKVASSASGQTRMVAFFEHSYAVIHQLGQILKEVAIGLFNTGKAASGSGQTMVNSIQGVVTHWANWTKSLGGQNTMKKFFEDVRKNVNAIMGLVDKLSGILIKMGASPMVGATASGLEKIITSIQKAFAGFSGGEAGKQITDIFNNIVKAIGLLGSKGGTLNTVLTTLDDLTKALMWFIQFPGVGDAILVIAGAFGAFKVLQFGASITKIGALTKAVSAFAKGMGAAGAATDGASFLQKVAGGIGRVGVADKDVNAARAAGTAVPINGVGKAIKAVSGVGRGVEGAAVAVNGEKAAVGVGKLGGAVSKAGAALSVFAGGPVMWIVLGIAALVAAFVLAYTKVKWFHDGVNNFFSEIGKAGQWLWNVALKPTFDFMAAHWKLIVDLMLGPMGLLITHFTQVAVVGKWLWENALKPAFNFIVAGFKAVAAGIQVGVQVIKVVFAAIAVAGERLWAGLHPIFIAIRDLFHALVWAIKVDIALWEGAFKVIEAAINFLWKNVVVPVFNAIKASISAVISWISAYLKREWDGIKIMASAVWGLIGGTITGIFSGVWTSLQKTWGLISAGLTTAFTVFKGVAKAAWDDVASTIVGAFQAISGPLGKVWDGVKTAFSAALNFIGQDIINPFIDAINAVVGTLPGGDKLKIKKLGNFADGGTVPTATGGTQKHVAAAGGGVLPGYTPGRDPHVFTSNTGLQIALSGGEGILVPEAVRALGGASAIQTINSSLSNGRVGMNGMAAPGGHFAGGGVLGSIWNGAKHLAGSGVGALRSAGAWATKEGLNAAEAPLRAGINAIPSALIKALANSSFKNLNDAAFNFIKGKQAQGNTTVTGGPQNSIGLDAGQMANARIISETAKAMGASPRDTEIAYMTGFVESSIRNLANPNVPESMALPHQGLGQDHDSVGIYQQRNSWGSAADRLNPAATTRLFLNRLLGLGNSRLSMTMGQAAQTVQVSAFPDRYASFQNQAVSLYDQINPAATTGTAGSSGGTAKHAYANGGIIQKFHAGGLVNHVGPGNSNAAIQALRFQTGEGVPGPTWSSHLTAAIRAREKGVSLSQGVTNTAAWPHDFSMKRNDPRIGGFANWMKVHKPKNYEASTAYFNGNSVGPVAAYKANPAYYNMTHWPRGFNPVPMLSRETKAAEGWDDSLRGAMGMRKTGQLWSADMNAPADHLMAHAIGQPHPANSVHPWNGAVTAVEQAIAAQDRGNTLNKEWYADLQTLANWGMPDLVQWLMDKGISDGLDTARSAVASRAQASTLNASIKAGNMITATGAAGSSGATILKIVSQIASGTASSPVGLRAVSSQLQMPDYGVVNLYEMMKPQLNALPKALTSKFNNDVSQFRKGLFYAATGGQVPGVGSGDTVPAMLTPGEFVLKKSAVQALGLGNAHALNNAGDQAGTQFFANGGIVMSPSVSTPTVHAVAPRAGAVTTNHESGGNTYVTNLNTEINNPTGENSVYAMNKMLQRRAVSGDFNRAAKVNGGS
jgi:hypothetical protein